MRWSDRVWACVLPPEREMSQRLQAVLISDDPTIYTRWQAQEHAETWSEVPRHSRDTHISKCNPLQRMGGSVPVTFCYVENGLESPVCCLASRLGQQVQTVVLMLVLKESQRQRYALSSRWVEGIKGQCDGRELVVLPPLFYRETRPYDIITLATWVQAGLGSVSRTSMGVGF